MFKTFKIKTALFGYTASSSCKWQMLSVLETYGRHARACKKALQSVGFQAGSRIWLTESAPRLDSCSIAVLLLGLGFFTLLLFGPVRYRGGSQAFL